jgi:hypothetical protein
MAFNESWLILIIRQKKKPTAKSTALDLNVQPNQIIIHKKRQLKAAFFIPRKKA